MRNDRKRRHFLPYRDMVKEFESVKNVVDSGGHGKLQELFRYVQRTWINLSIWKPKDISECQRMVRTNNDLEGYHRRLNTRCGSDHPPVYKLLEVFHDEAKLVTFTCKAISSDHVAMVRRKKTLEIQAKLQNIWNDYEDGLFTMFVFSQFRMFTLWIAELV